MDHKKVAKEIVKALAGGLWVSLLRFDFRLLSNDKKSRSSTASIFSWYI